MKRLSYWLPVLALGLGTVVYVIADDDAPRAEKEKPQSERRDGDRPPVREGDRPAPPVREGERPLPPRDGERTFPPREGDRPFPPREGEGFRNAPRRDGDRPGGVGDERGPRPGVRPDGPPPPREGFFGEGDPEMNELAHKDMELERQSFELARRYREVEGSERDEIRMQLAKTVEAHFNTRQARRELQIKRMSAELDRLKEEVEARNSAREAILNRRVQELAGDDGKLGF